MNIIEVNERIEIEYRGEKIPVIIEELRVSPISMRVKYKSDETWPLDWNYNLEFEFLDETNKKVYFTSMGGSLEQGMSYKYIIDREINKLKVTPIIRKYSKFWSTKKEFKDKGIEINIK